MFRYFASISGTHAIVYDVRSGKRRLILNGDAKFCGLKWQDENTVSIFLNAIFKFVNGLIV